jgi:hypothetical protein
MTARRLVISHARAPGDVTVLTALVRDIQLSRPGEFLIDVDTTSQELWNNNPHITKFSRAGLKDVEYHKADYGMGLQVSEYETVHFMSYFHRDFKDKLKIDIPVTKPYPDLHLSAEEKATSPVSGRYWLCFPGGKTDFTAKLWSISQWSELVSRLSARGFACVQGGNGNVRGDVKHINPDIPGMALNVVGRTGLRELLQLIYHAEGVICGVTFPMHAAAALQKPCVVIGGGRESWWWEAYVRENTGLGPPAVLSQLKVPHRFLHTIGHLDCARHHGCGRCNVLPTDEKRSFCTNPIISPGDTIPLCMQMITVEMVETAVWSYYLDGTIPTLPNGIVLKPVI